MNRFQKLSSIAFLLLAFIYPPALAEAKNNTVNHALNAETNLVEDKNGEILITHRWTRKRYRRHKRTRRYYHYYRTRRHYYKRGHHYRHYYGQPYRHGKWKLVRDRYGRLVYEWRSHY